MLPLASTRIINCERSLAIVSAVLLVVRALASPATTLAVASTYVHEQC